LEGYLGWKEIREMRRAGMRFGAHSVSHPRLTEIPLNEARGEVRDCKKALEDGLGEEVPLFCYPYGFLNRAIRDLIEEAGYRGACCNAPGRLWPDGDFLALKRVTMTYRMNRRIVLSASLSGYYVFYKELRSGNKEYILDNHK
jgi:peptidoglycan/xylan/chitin deacetylase (PgdA/CDA1 family)